MDKIGSLLNDHHSAMHKWKGLFDPKVAKKIAANIAKSQTYPTHVYIGGSIKVSIRRTYLDVDFNCRSFTFKAWKMSGIPCDHACAAIRRFGLDISNYLKHCFKLTC